MAIDYSEYLRLEALIGLQGGADGDEKQLARDELLFITVHQIDELWFKLVLSELEKVRDVFARDIVNEGDLAPAARGLRRCTTAFELAAAHFALMETMSPRDFLDFRAKLAPASGFQSPQFREVEYLLGLDDATRLRLNPQQGVLDAFEPKAGIVGFAQKKLAARRAAGPTLKSALEKWLARTPIDGSAAGSAGDDARVAAFLDAYLAAHAREVDAALELSRAGGIGDAQVAALHEAEKRDAEQFLRDGSDVRADLLRRRLRAAALFIESYRDLPLLAWPREVLDLVIALEQAFLVFRQRHARMVERMIGRRVGTGGSDGVHYLDQTALKYRIFDELWRVRRLLVKKDAVPPLARADFYGFIAAPRDRR